MKHHRQSSTPIGVVIVCGALMGVVALGIGGCELQQRRVDVPTASGADESLKDRFGLTDDAQDPTEHDKEMGYGVWKAKPEPTGTQSPKSPARRGSHWNTIDN